MAGGISEETLAAMAACNVAIGGAKQIARNQGIKLEDAAKQICRMSMEHRIRLLRRDWETARAAGIDVPWPAPEAVPSGK